jgi:hypothetical protein
MTMQGTNEANRKQTDFGIFYPFGYIVAAFGRKEDAIRVQEHLLTGGYDAADCVLETGVEMAIAAGKNLEDNPGWLSRLGMSDEAVQQHLDAANQGATFLRIFAPGDTDVERAMNVVRRVPFELAHLYRRFAIEDMK